MRSARNKRKKIDLIEKNITKIKKISEVVK